MSERAYDRACIERAYNGSLTFTLGTLSLRNANTQRATQILVILYRLGYRAATAGCADRPTYSLQWPGMLLDAAPHACTCT